VSVAIVAKEILINDSSYKFGNRSIYYGDLDILHAIYDKAGLSLKNSHPLNKCAAVLNALDSHCNCKKPLWKKIYWRAHKGLARGFELTYERK